MCVFISLHNMIWRKYLFSALENCHTLFYVWTAFNSLSFALSMLWNNLSEFFYCEVLLALFPLGHLHPFHHPFPFYASKFAFIKFLWHPICSLSNSVSKTFPWPALSSISPFILCSIRISFLPLSLFISSLQVYLCFLIPFLDYGHLCTLLSGFIPERQESKETAHFAVSE